MRYLRQFCCINNVNSQSVIEILQNKYVALALWYLAAKLPGSDRFKSCGGYGLGTQCLDVMCQHNTAVVGQFSHRLALIFPVVYDF